MPRPRKFESDAMKQRAYRCRRKARETDEEKLHYARLEQLHRVVQRAALDGQEAAKKMLGRNASDTALKLLFATQPAPLNDDDDAPLQLEYVGFNIAYYAYEEAASCVLLEKSELKDGVFRLVIGTENRTPRRAKSIAERPKRQGQGRERPKFKSSRAAPKGR